MTANEFLENVNSYYDLKDFCSETGCDYCDNILDDDSLDEEVDYALSEYRRDYNWREIRDLLSDIPTGYDWYRCDGSFDYVGLDDSDFDDIKDEVYEWALNNGYFDDEVDEDEEEYEEESVEEDDYEPLEEEDFSVGDLFGMCNVTFVAIQQDNMRRLQEADAAFSQFIDVNMPKVLH